MKQPTLQDNWLNSWKSSFSYDLLEIYGSLDIPGYAYAYRNRRKHTLELIQKVAKPGAKILDVAAAQGNFTLSLAELGYEVTWNDLREELIDYVKLKWESGIVHYSPGNIFDINFDDQFDVVLITEVIEHVAHPDDFLKSIANMLKPSGHIVLSTPNGDYFKNNLPRFSDCPDPSQYEKVQFQPNSDGHIFLLHLDEIEQLINHAGLVVKETRLVTNSLTNGHIKLHHLLKLLPKSWVETFEAFTYSMPLAIKSKLHTTTLVLLAALVS
ncbi:SAM-dependent methyltransferase [Pseudanabaena sp. SR411]|uniref:class I SAM-dependent methyltransferase n=1 Tax=Pseudanabaena sp. SR411 TaxID=1980935 RepID=UPI000B985F5B|nr:methyltransferase domain-containing protein [Pseudanabaena sp. SR411]OYQ63517.1 SAM-dependent methyltransferase [Pseudanabaena sp. SR411]